MGQGGGLETDASLQFLCDLYNKLKLDLKKVLDQRMTDRKFIDERVKACYEFNTSLEIDFLDSKYKTILGLEDAKGRIVIGPKAKDFCNSRTNAAIAPLPEFLKGPHVTLFGPPGSAKMAINAMNTYHRKLKEEPKIVETLLKTHTSVPKWGADDEDSKTPLRSDLVSSAVNLTKCFTGELSFENYKLADNNLSVPIKRFPGLALPCTFLFLDGSPLPLHLYDFALHLFANWNNPKALVFYVPKLENEEEARYIHKMIAEAEAMIKVSHPEYILGSVRLMIVLENPRAILRTHEIIDELYPYFAGASLGWHDYLGSTARLFKEDGNYRIPVKADPDIVIKYIQASHNVLADVVGSRGGIKVGGMYGILPLDTDLFSESFQVTIKGYIKDVVTQMKRNLTGFWVAHPDFVRLGLALVEAWKFHAEGKPALLRELVESLLDKKYHNEIMDFINKPDIRALDKSDPNFVRSLIVADIKESDYIANNHPDEIRYNVFQSLQYLTDWLSGNGCVALPALVNGVSVRVMDDLATAERSRWEVWHEIYHGRFSKEDFLKIAFEEFQFIRKDLSHSKKIVQVKWTKETEKWYPVALHLMVQLMTAKKPVEFATELLMPFTVEAVRAALDPLKALTEIDAQKFQLEPYVNKFMHYFESCGCVRFASEMAKSHAEEPGQICELILSFSKSEILEAASFHGNIGEEKKTLDVFAANEQALVFSEDEKIKNELHDKGASYLLKFGMKFLISAQGKSGSEILKSLTARLNKTEAQELDHAREALLHITLKRLREKPHDMLLEKLEALLKKHGVNSASIAVSEKGHSQSLSLGQEKRSAWFQLASLSKTLASAFALEYFAKNNIDINSPVDEILKETKSKFRLGNNKVTLKHLMNHQALNMHYVNGYHLNEKIPSVSELLSQIKVLNPPGEVFSYSGGGFIVLEHLIEMLEEKSIQEITEEFYDGLSFSQHNLPHTDYAFGHFDDGITVPGTRLQFPAFAAGAMGTAKGLMDFLNDLTTAYHSLDGFTISHDTAVNMLFGEDKGCREFMGCDIGLGVFVKECGDNKMAIHQGANEGFRCLYVHCFDGPDQGSGLVILCNADKKGVNFIAEAAQEILKSLNISGIDFHKFKSTFSSENVSAENLVNKGYKELIFEAFEPTLPEEIIKKGPRDPLASSNLLTKSKIIGVTNQKFARATSLQSEFEPIFDPELFGRQGKIMDSWESARHNPLLFDWLRLSLEKPSVVNFIQLSTKFHDGNQAEFVRILGYTAAGHEVELLPKQQMHGHAYLKAKSHSQELIAAVKIEMYPDGGLSRVGLYADLPEGEKANFNMTESKRFADEIPRTTKPLSLKYEATKEDVQKNLKLTEKNLAGLAFGAKLVSATNEHYGPAIQVISPFPPIHMFDGLESSRSRKPGHFEEVVIELAEKKPIQSVILDFKFFVNNNPREVSLEAFSDGKWHSLVEKTFVKPFAGNKKEFKIDSQLSFSQLKLKTYPDGGINRIFVL